MDLRRTKRHGVRDFDKASLPFQLFGLGHRGMLYDFRWLMPFRLSVLERRDKSAGRRQTMQRKELKYPTQ